LDVSWHLAHLKVASMAEFVGNDPLGRFDLAQLRWPSITNNWPLFTRRPVAAHLASGVYQTGQIMNPFHVIGTLIILALFGGLVWRILQHIS